MPQIQRPRAILFDWDNTLVDTWPVIHQALKSTFEAYAMTPWTLDEVKQRVARSMRDSFPDLFGEKWEEAGELYKNNYRAIHRDMLKPLDGAEDILKRLEQTDIFIGVVSNKTGPILRKEVPYLQWNRYFEVLIGSGDAAKDKPHADPILKALENSGFKPSEDVWLVGDSIIDVECSKESGIQCVVYGELTPERQSNGVLMIKDYSVMAHVRDHGELKNLLSSLLC